MKTLIQKDLRENVKLALIGLLVFSLLLLSAYQSGAAALTNLLRGNWGGQTDALQPLLSMALLTQTAFFCAIYGAALGWLQTRNEAHRDLWAFLIHRPLTRVEIFWGKTVAGLCLYVFGAGLPLVVLVAVVRTPGHVAAPFEWEMVLPLVSIFLTGFAYYFAGMLTGLRQARWWVSRAFGLAPAFVASMSVFAGPAFWVAHIVLLIVVAVLAVAARGAYQSGGWYRGQPVAGRLALTATMTAGCAVVLFAGLGLAFNLLLDPFFHRQPYEYTNFQMTRDGEIYKVTTRDGETAEITDLDGHPLMDPKTGQRMDRKEFQKRTAYGPSVMSTLGRPRPNRNSFQDDSSRFFSLLNITDKTLWYLDRHGKLMGYNGRTRQFIGNIDAHAPGGTAAIEPFLPNHSYYSSYNDVPLKWLATAKTVYRVDFKDRTASPVFTVSNDDEIGGYAGEVSGYQDYPAKEIFITTRHTIHLMDGEGHSLLTLPYQPGYAEYPQVQLEFLKATNTFSIWLYPDYVLNEKADWKMPIHVRWVGLESALTKSIDLPVIRQHYEEPLSSKLLTSLLPPPVHVQFNRKIYGAWNLFSLALGAVCTVIGWRLVRRYNASTKAAVGWTLFVFVLGLPGLLTLLVVQEWPVREACPQCSKLRAVDREDCEHCAATFAPPEKNGTEIFAPLEKV